MVLMPVLIMKAPSYDIDEYNALLENFKKSRQNVVHLAVYKELCLLQPDRKIPVSLRCKLRKFCRTNPSSSWGACKVPAQKIWDFLFK
jgi:hypothetical protein